MTSNNIYTNQVCYRCSKPATHQTVLGKFVCHLKPSKCSTVIEKQKLSRNKTWGSPENMRAHMKQMSLLGNSSAKRQSKEYKDRVGANISKKRIELGLASGESNPNYNGKITNNPEIRAKMRKPKLDSSKMGRYERTQEHRDIISAATSKRRPIYKRSSIEKKISLLLKELSLEYNHEFLIQSKEYAGYNKLFYRHVYDFFIKSLNLIIECDGEYWHGNKRQWIVDTKASYVASEKGYRLFRFSESFIKNLDINLFREILTNNSTFAVFGDFYNTIPVREFGRNTTPDIICYHLT